MSEHTKSALQESIGANPSYILDLAQSAERERRAWFRLGGRDGNNVTIPQISHLFGVQAKGAKFTVAGLVAQDAASFDVRIRHFEEMKKLDTSDAVDNAINFFAAHHNRDIQAFYQRMIKNWAKFSVSAERRKARGQSERVYEPDQQKAVKSLRDAELYARQYIASIAAEEYLKHKFWYSDPNFYFSHE